MAILTLVPQRLLIVGESLVEFVRPERGLGFSQPGAFLGPWPSGAPAICADAAAVSGAKVALVSTVGTDPFGRLLLERLTTDGVDVSGIRVLDDAVTGTAFVAYDWDGSRTFVFHVADAAPGGITAADLGSAPESADWIHVSGASLALSPAMAAAIMVAVERVLAHGGRVSFDPNLRAGSSGISDLPEAMARLLEVASLLLPADGELEALGVDRDALVARGTVVCETAGAEGARLHASGGITVIPGLAITEVDPTGAGDTFAGVFLATFLRTGDAHQAAIVANRAGAAHVAAMGPMERSATWEPERA
jgi:sugar/nucleoside kinase (ribokinase family)